ncbi:MAG: beta-ketoacyl synthase chain length factor [Hyphomonadaceae bacterium]|nr:beta-ketoacyl synthase chain length factor [Hyphomonadaceae bacterium]
MTGQLKQDNRPVRVHRIAAISNIGEKPEYRGSALALADLPRASTRRLSQFEKCVIACVMGLGDDLRGIPLVMASRYGTVASNTLHLLKELADGEPLSPTRFSLSVHNAAIGLASQLTKNTAGYTAISAGAHTLQALWTEALARLLDGVDKLIIVYADFRLQDEYSPFNTIAADCCFAAMISLEATESARPSRLGTLMEAGDIEACLAHLQTLAGDLV